MVTLLEVGGSSMKKAKIIKQNKYYNTQFEYEDNCKFIDYKHIICYNLNKKLKSILLA